MNVCPYGITLIAGGFTILGVLIGVLVTYYFALRLASINSRRDAGRRLREAFAPELAALHPISGKKDINVENLLQEALIRHQTAIIEFQDYLRGAEKIQFEKVWKEYYEVGGSPRFFDYYMDDNGNPRQCFQDRVNSILKFTET